MHPKLSTQILQFYFRKFPISRGKARVRNWVRGVLGDRRQLSQFDNGILIYLSLAEPMQARIFFEGMYEPNLTRRFAQLIRPDSIVVDVGANIGLYTLLAARRTNHAGQIFAFEPAPSEYAYLAENVQLNHFKTHVNLFQIGLSDLPERRKLKLSGNRNQGIHTFSDRQVGTSEYETKLLPLHTLLQEHAVSHIDLIKIDVEGWEYRVLKGAGRYLEMERRPIIFFEVCEEYLAAAGASSVQIKNLLIALDYQLFRVTEEGVFLPVANSQKHEFDNLIAIPKERMSEEVLSLE